MPASEYPSQRLYRVFVSGKEGSGSAKVTLRFWSPSEYEARAADALGRPLWLVSVDHGRALMLDLRARTYCRGHLILRFPVLDFGPLPLEALPRLLIGRLPLPPAREQLVASKGDGEFRFSDAEGRVWSGKLDDGWPVRWTVGDPKPLVWWQRSADGDILSRRGGGQVRWHQEVREKLPRGDGSTRPSLLPPAGFKKARCDESSLP